MQMFSILIATFKQSTRKLLAEFESTQQSLDDSIRTFENVEDPNLKIQELLSRAETNIIQTTEGNFRYCYNLWHNNFKGPPLIDLSSDDEIQEVSSDEQSLDKTE